MYIGRFKFLGAAKIDVPGNHPKPRALTLLYFLALTVAVWPPGSTA